MIHKIFLFHRVSPHRDPLWDPMDPKLFEKCIKYIHNKYELINLEYYLNNRYCGKKKNTASIVFDDGYKDNIEFAAPILNEANIKASFYVVTNSIDDQHLTWTHQLEYSFQNTNKCEIDLSGIPHIPAEFKAAKWHNPNERLKFAARIKPWLKTIGHKERENILTAIKNQFNDIVLPTDMMMAWDDLIKLKEQGHVIGSHTVNHLMLGTIDSYAEIEEELFLSGKRIEEKLGAFPDTISYPVGSYDSRVVELSKKVGYKYGLAVKQMFYNPAKDSVFEIPRTELYNESWWKTRMRISGSLERIKKLIRK